MKEGIKLNSSIFIFIFNVCKSLDFLEFGKWVYFLIMKVGLEFDFYVSNVFVSMFVNCGDLMFVKNLFNDMFKWDLVLWNIIIVGFV